MIDSYNESCTGWARFSDDMTMRFRLVRVIGDVTMAVNFDRVSIAPRMPSPFPVTPNRVVFLMLNPSTADAFKLDPTVQNCLKFATGWGANILEVVNLFAWRSTYPVDLAKRAHGERGDDEDNNKAIFDACKGATYVIAAWGNGGVLGGRAASVLNMLSLYRIPLHHLGLTKEGFPKHPLARGKHRIMSDQQPIAWTP